MILKTRKQRLCLCIPATLLLILAVALFVLLLTFDQIFLTLVAKSLALSPSSPVYKNWLKPEVPIYFSVYLFNLTNLDEVLAGGRPSLQEVGPFIYRESRERFDVKFGNGSLAHTVRYKHRIFYHFERSISLTDPNNVSIVTPDLYFMGLLSEGLSMLGSSVPFIKLTAQQAMWGYFPSWYIPFKVGLFSKHNGTNVNEFLVDTGANNIKDIGKIYEVDGKKNLNIWNHAEANMINGTDGSLAPPGLDVGSTVTFHVPEICRSSTMYAIKRKPTVTRKDIEVVAFSAAPPDPMDPLAKWRSQMFCSATEGCPPKGLVDLRTCLSSKGPSVPLFLSQPFFLNADPSISAAFDGLPVPQESLHSTWVHIEPTTGFVLEAFKRVQFNILMTNVNSYFGRMAGPYYFPIGWISEVAVADEKALAMLSDKVLRPRNKLPFLIAIVSAAVFLSALILYVALFICSRRSFWAGKRSNVVVPSAHSASHKEESLETRLTPWTSSKTGENTQAPETKPLLHRSKNVDPHIPVV